MIPVVSVVGRSDSGKTTLIEKLIPELNRRGYRVGTVKHDVHGFDIDHPGKDTWRHAQAGSELVLISSPSKAAMIKRVNTELTLDQIAGRYVSEVDVILTEGFKREAKPKVEILREGEELLSPVDQLLFIVSDAAANGGSGVPVVGADDLAAMGDLIEDHIKQSSAVMIVDLEVDGKPIPLNGIMRGMVANTVAGMIKSLKGVPAEPREVKLTVRAQSRRG